MKLKIGTPEEFQAWCQERADKVVGKARSHCDCPIANWLTELNGWASEVIVGMFSVHYANNPDGPAPRQHPRWIREFIARVDMLGALHGDEIMRVTGKEALEYLAVAMESL